MATTTATTKLSKGIMPSRIAQLNIKHSKLLIAFLLFLFVALPAYAVDTTPPVTTAAPGSGIYNTTQSVTLTANESAAIYYTTNGPTPTMSSNVYTDAISISANTVLKFFAVDGDDNVEAVQTVAYTFDMTLPSGSIVINNGDDITPLAAVTLTLTCADASGCNQMQLSNDDVTYSTAVSFSTAATWTLASGADGLRSVYVKFKDGSGNWSDPFSDAITLDTTIPVGQWFDQLPKTGQTASYATRDDGASQTGATWPNPRFTITYRDATSDCAVQTSDCDATSSNDVVMDNLTGLIWTRDGNAPGPSACGPGTPKNWQAALDYAACLNTNNYLGHNDWRLPNITELYSLVNIGQSSQTTWLNAQGFVNTQTVNWSSTAYAGDTEVAWGVYFSIGGSNYYYKMNNYYVRCVRGHNPSTDNSIISLFRTGQTTSYATGDDGATQAGATWPNPRFTITYRDATSDCAVQTSDCDATSSNDVVMDNLTGLIWTRDGNAPGPSACGPGTPKNWQAALDYAACLNTNNYLGHNDWRLPNITELYSLVNIGQSSQTTWLNAQGFVNVQGFYWSSTTYAYLTTLAWLVGFDGGDSGGYGKAEGYYVRCVRGPNGSFRYVGILIERGATVVKNAVVSIRLNATHPNGVAEVMFSDDNVNWSAPVSYVTTTNYTLPAGDGTKTVYVRFRANGNTSWSQVYSDSIVLDTTAPVTTATPAGGLYPAQTVTLSANETGSTIYYTLDGSTPTISSTVYSFPISIATSTTLKFFAVDKIGNAEEVKSATYTIDAVLPSGCSLIINGGSSETNSYNVTLTLSATDSNGITEMKFHNENTATWTAPEPYATEKSWTLSPIEGLKTVYAKFKDAAGNWSVSATRTITVNTPPQGGGDFILPKTGQLISYGASDDGDLQKGVSWPNPRFVVTSSGTGTVVADNLTGLVWTQDANTPGPAACSPAITKTWADAFTYVACLNSKNYLGHDDWRLPNVNELKSLVHGGQSNTADWLNTQGFLNVSPSDAYWSSTTMASYTNSAWAVQMIGFVSSPGKTSNYCVWPVRSGQCGSLTNSTSCLPKTGQTAVFTAGDDGSQQAGFVWPSSRFTVLSSGTGTVVSDGLTGLMWTQDANAPGPAACSPNSHKSWDDALAYVSCLNASNYLAYNNWRLPNLSELNSIVNRGQVNNIAWLNSQGFVNAQADFYWSSSTDTQSTNWAWSVVLDGGYVINQNKIANYCVWPLRSGQFGTSVAVGVLFSRGAVTQNQLNVMLQLNATDANGVAEMSLSNDGTNWLTPEPYVDIKAWTLSEGDGAKTVYVKFKDSTGLWSAVYSDSIILDTTPPVTDLNSTPTSLTTSTNAAFTFTAEVGATFECQFDAGSYSSCTSPASFSGLSDGIHSFSVRATDTIGNMETPVLYSWTIDSTAPAAMISAPSAMFTRHGDVTYTISYIDADNINLTSNNITLNTTGTASGFVAVSGTGNSSRTVTISGITGDGTLSISIAAATASDAAGNTAAASGPSATFIVDNTLPVVSAGANKTKNVQFTQTATATDANNMTYVWTKQTGTGNITFGSPDTKATTVSSDTNGTFTLRFTATDEAGNSAYSDMTLIWDTVAPNAPVVAGTTPNNSATPTWTWTSGGNGGNGTYRYSLDNSDLSSGAVVTTGRSALPATGLSDAIHTLYVQERDIAGNWSSSGSFAILVDATAPNTSASIPGGLYKTVQNVTLTCNDGTGTSGCKAIYYTTDNNTPTQSSAQYSTPIAVNADTTLKFLSVDFAGNPEAVHTIDYTIDTAAPAVAISAPLPASQVDYLDEISGTATDSGSGVSLVELQIVYNTKYLNASGIFTTTPMWLPAIGTTTWSYYVSSGIWANNATYTVKARATDTAGNVSTLAQTTFTKVLVIEQAFTTLSLDLSTQTMLQNGTLTASGKLTRMPDNGTNLAGKTVTLLVTGPTGTAQLLTTTTYDIYGHYIFNNVSGFTQKGSYTVTISFAGGTLLAPSTSESKVVLVGASAGYAIIVEGKITGQEGLESHNKTANRIYGKLKDRGFVDDNIQYFNYQAQTGVDTTPSKGAIQFAVETWALTKMNGSPAPLFIIMVDHGSPDIFYLNNETITPTELAAWVATLETGLSAPALAEKRVIIVGSCYSGSFVSALAHSGRVIVTSAAEDEESYKGPNEPDNIRSGEFFLEEFFKELGRGRSLGQSFAAATDVTEVYTRKGGTSPNGNGSNKYLDNAMQHPLLEDNDDGKGSNVLSGDSGDGARASNLYLGIGISYDTNSAANPADITAVTETKHLVSGPSTTVLLWARANDDNEVSSAWIEIRTPSKTLAAVGGSNQLEVTLTKVLMSLVSDPSGTRWEADYNAFTESGMYEIFYFVRDVKTSDISQMKRSVVYKDKDLNTPPGAFTLVSPVNGSEQKTMLIFDWNDSIDPDADFVTYSVMIATDAAFTNMVYLKEELPNSYLALGSEAGLKDLTTYYWKVRATDPYGAYRDVGQNRNFSTNNTNGLPGFIYGYVLDAATEAPVSNATIYSSSSGTGRSAYNGAYVLSVPTGDMTLRATATGYQDSPITNLMITPGSSNNRNIRLNIVVYSLTVGKSGTGTGSITSNPAGISCGATCSQTYNANTVVTLTATPAAGSSFTNWSGACTGTGTCSVTMNAAKTVSAVFTLLPDSTPTAFKFMDQANVALNTVVTSNTITVTGINTAAAISIANGTYSVNNGIFTSASGSVTNGAAIRVQLTSSATFSTAKEVTLTIGGVSDTFTVTTLKGTTAPIATYTPATLPSFGNQLITTISAAKIVKVTNTGTAPLMILNTLISGTNAGQFSKTTTCPTGTTGLASGETCTIRVMFKPTATGLKNASLQVNVSLPALSKAIALTGTGTAPVATVTPTVLSFGTITNKTTSAAKAVKVTNTGSAPLFLSTSITGSNPGQFTQVSTCPTGTASLATGATCTINVTFKPTAIGLKSASLSIDVAAPAVSKKVTLSGTGK